MVFVSYAREVVSPPLGVELGGYGFYRGRFNKGVHDDLYARVLFVEEGSESFLLFNADLLEVNGEFVREVRGRVSRALGIREENIVFTVTHTHYAPPTTYFRGCGRVSRDYVKMLSEKFVSVVERLEDRIYKVKVFYGEAPVEDDAFNRVVKGGSVDPSVRVLQFRRQGEVVATLFNYSCHPVCIDVRTEAGYYVSADWPGVTMKIIDGEYGGLTFFLQGTCGDIDPVVAWKMRGFDASEEIGVGVAESVKRALNVAVEVGDGFKVVSRRVKLPLQKLTYNSFTKIIAMFLRRIEFTKVEKFEDIGGLRKSIRFCRETLEEMSDLIEKGLPDHVDTELHAVRFGNVALLFLPGEVFVKVFLDLREKSPFKKLMVAGYSGKYVGYIPTPEEFDRKGYAAYTVPLLVNLPPYVPNIAYILEKKSLEILMELVK